MATIKFISYDGECPCLCSGNLVIEIDGIQHVLSRCLVSGGCVSCDEEGYPYVTQGPWDVNLANYPQLEPYSEEIAKVVNENVTWGCCGGCV